MIVGLCSTRPADWWDPADDGARLALALCRVCPSLAECPAGDPHPKGVIRAGVAYGDNGTVLPTCPTCGYPQASYTGGGVQADCRRCRVPEMPIRFLGLEARRTYWRERRRASREAA